MAVMDMCECVMREAKVEQWWSKSGVKVGMECVPRRGRPGVHAEPQ